MSILNNIFTANRVAAISTWLAALAALIASVEGTFPKSWQNTALAISALLVKAVTALKFLDGSQKSEALNAGNEGDLALAGTENSASASAFEEGPPAEVDSAVAQDELTSPGTPAQEIKYAGAPDPAPQGNAGTTASSGVTTTGTPTQPPASTTPGA